MGTLGKRWTVPHLRRPRNKIFGRKSKRDRSLRFLVLQHGLLLPYECSKCKNPGEWQGEILVLHLDHIDGDGLNDVRSNLRWLCPNCHSQTETWCVKKRQHKP